MSSEGSLGRGDWIEAGMRALAEGGLGAVRVEALARALGVTKGSFYWHFKNRDALLEAMLAHWEEHQTAAIITQVESLGGDARARLEALARLATTDANNVFEMALRDAARRESALAAVIRRVDGRRMAYLNQLFVDLGCPPLEAEARSLLTYSLLIGDFFIVTGHDPSARHDVLRECRRLLFELVRAQPGDGWRVW